MAEKKLLVIFHGAWAFVDNRDGGEDCIRAYAPEVPSHVYMAGSWLGETKIPPKSHLTLNIDRKQDCNHTGAGDSVWGHREGMVLFPKKKGCPEESAPHYVQVTLPRPTAFHAEMIIPDVEVTFNPGDPHNQQTTIQNLGLVPVFEYVFSDPPSLTGEYVGKSLNFFWQPPVGAPMEVTTLHLFAADDTRYGDPGGDFIKIAPLLGCPASLSALSEVSGVPMANRVVKTSGLQGREFEVTTFLYQRMDHLRAIGSQMQYRGEKSIFVWEPPLETPPPPPKPGESPYLFDLASCGGGGGGS